MQRAALSPEILVAYNYAEMLFHSGYCLLNNLYSAEPVFPSRLWPFVSKEAWVLQLSAYQRLFPTAIYQVHGRSPFAIGLI